ncbi:MAG TPA: GNAT family N-acetyltransferase [Trueperaceae bacterium]
MVATVRLASTDDEILRCYPIMRELRTHLEETSFLERVRRQEREGYRLAYLHRNGEVLAVAGFRISEFLAYGRILYVDDLVTAPAHRSTGSGKVLVDWLTERARGAGCNELHLDSGTQRRSAHRFYHREGLEIVNFHFAKRV